MPTLLLRFPARRYHATPWGHHANEGLIEWPPSPWRLLRALLSVGYSALGWDAAPGTPWQSVPPDAPRSLILKLAGVLPSYALPPAVGAHTRHFMPMGIFKNGSEHRSLFLDTWAQVERGEVAVRWDVELQPEESRLLGELADRLGYLGRSESWVSARLADEREAQSLAFNCLPSGVAPHPGPGWEQVSLLAAESPQRYLDWRRERIDAALVQLPSIPLPDKKKLALKDRRPTDDREAERRRAVEPYLPDVIACLQADTSWLRTHRWSQPPGSRRVLYWRRNDALRAPALVLSGTGGPTDTVPFVLLSLSSQSGNDHALPPLARSLPQGEMLHRQMVGARVRIGPARHSRVLTGRDETGNALRGAHRHAHVLSLDLDGDGHIDHLLVWAADGIDALDRRAASMTRGTYSKGGIGALRLAWSAAGDREQLARLPAPRGDALWRTIGEGRIWISATPFVPPRYVKRSGANSLEGQLRAELASRGLPEPLDVQWLDPQRSELARRLRHHVRVRRNGGPPPIDVGYAIRLTFRDAITGPVCLGYGSHFGLGRFELDTQAQGGDAAG